MKLPYFDYCEPRTRDELLTVLSEQAGKPFLIAGGTDILPLVRFGLAQPARLVSLRGVPGLKGVAIRDGELHIGCMTTLTELLSVEEVKGDFVAFREALEAVAAPPIRNAGTIGGNLCQNSRCLFYNQSKTWREEHSPCFKAGGDVCLAVPGGKKCFSVYQGDLACTLIAFGARIKIEKEGSSHSIPLEELFSGDAKRPIGLGNDEIITEVVLAVPPAGTGSAYRKLRLRSAIDYPLISVAATVSLNGRGTIGKTRLVLGAAGPAPSVAHEAEAMLLGKEPKHVDLDAAGQAVARGAQMVNNLELPASYRRTMIPVFARRAIEAAMMGALGKERS